MYMQYSKSMVHLIFNTKFGFWDLQLLFLQSLMLYNIIFKIKIKFIIYIEKSMNIFIVYIDIIRPCLVLTAFF
jgi:hypothetical protein